MISSSSVLFPIVLYFIFGFFSSLLGIKIISSVVRFFQYRNRVKLIVQRARSEAQENLERTKDFLSKHKEEKDFEWEQKKEEDEAKIYQWKKRLQEKRKDFHESSLQKRDFFSNKEIFLNQFEQKMVDKQNEIFLKKEEEKKRKKQLIDQLELQSGESKENLVSDFKRDFLLDMKTSLKKWRQSYEEEIQFSAERLAKRILMIVINRFSRPYCAERGIGFVSFKNIKGNREKTLEYLRENVFPIIEEKCGVDIVYHSKTGFLSISGFDPARKELGRLVLKKTLKDKKHLLVKASLSQRISKIVIRIKRELFSRIRRDGEVVTKELDLSHLHQNIKNMLGVLRYRYSFTQNQYFHCSEVGFLCGLLSSELNLSLVHGREAGLLHDIGKAMDHSVEGGHAVIGADFIQKNGVHPDVVHAVRAHHYDETPRIHLSYLVMAADALSGARPGARHSTLSVFTQKVDQLQSIGNSFEGVLDTYVLNAGREVRVFVDSRKITDFGAIDLSRDISKEIESKCIYPGQIKVTVVRRTEAKEVAT